MSKFYTTSSELFNNNNKTDIPKWMQTLSENVQYKEREKLDINFDKRGAFASSTQVNRDSSNATPRDVIASLNNDKIILDSKTELAKFLLGKYYKTDVNVDNNVVKLATTIDGIQAKFVFTYIFDNGKTIANNTFSINGEEYPFSKAGFNESLIDLKNGLIKKPTEKIANSHKTFVINREEIIRRFNGHLREATDTINKHLKDGIIIGAGSNSYASFYDPDELFPQEEKERPQLPTGSFEFVNNTEHVATNEFKSARKLSLEASKIISNLFSDYIINNSARDNNELLLNTTIFNDKNGIRYNVNFNFDIQNEKLASLRLAEINNQRMTIDQLLNKLNMNNNLVNEYLKTATASKHICSGIILTKRELKDKLGPIVGINKVDEYINSWLSVYAISPMNSTTYYSSNTIEELLDMVCGDTLTKEQIAQINEYKKVFGSGMDFDRVEQKDTGNRDLEDINLTDEEKLMKINKVLSNKFKHYQIHDFKNEGDNLNLVIAIKDSSINTLFNLNSKFNGRKLEKLNVVINNKEVSLDNLSSFFLTHPVLKDYVQKNGVNLYSKSIIASENRLLKQLSEIIPNPHEILNIWKKHYLKEIGSGLYSSKNTIEELLYITASNLSINVIPLTENEKQQMLIAKQHFGRALERIAEKDTGIRDTDDINLSNELKLSKINSILSKKIKNYQIVDYNNNNIKVLFSKDGVRHTLQLTSKFNGRKLEKLNAIVNNKEVSLDNLTIAFKNNELLNSYLQNNNVNDFSTTIIASEDNLFNRLSNLIQNPKEVLNIWKKHYLKEVSAGLYSSSYTFEELLNKTNAIPLSISEKNQILIAKQYFGNAFERIAEKDTGIRDMENRVNNETLLYEANNFLSQQFINYLPESFKSQDEIANYSITLFDEDTGLSTSVNFSFKFDNNKVKSCHANVNGELIELSNIKKVFAMNETLNKYLQLNNGKKFNAPMVISKNDLMRRLSSITNADSKEIDNIIELWKQYGKVHQLDMNTFASKLSLEQLISMSNIKPLSDEEIMEKLNRSSRNRGMNVTSNYINDNDTRRPEEIWSLEKIVLHARASINNMFADFDIIDAELNNNDYIITARIINPINGLKQCLSFKFDTINGTKLGQINSISNGIKSVTSNNILELLESKDEAINRFIKLNGSVKKQYKNIISNSNLKSKLITLINLKDYNNVVNTLVKSAILKPIDNFNFASEYSFSELIEYLSNSNILNLKEADKNLKTYSKDIVVDTNIKHVKDTDNRILEKKIQKLSPNLIKTCDKLKTLISTAKSNKKITKNKYDSLLNSLNIAKNGNDIENIWRELKRYI